MLILAFDSSGPACSVALWQDGKVLGQAQQIMERGQAEALLPMIEQVMHGAMLDYQALDRIAVTVGPGSFTGVRVGLATARGLALASNKPCVGILTTEAVAAAVPDDQRTHPILVAIDTKRGDLYVQLFDRAGTALSEPLALEPAALSAWVGAKTVTIAGDGTDAAAAALGSLGERARSSVSPYPVIVAALAAERTPIPGGPLPVYVHPPAITPPKP